MQKIQQNATKQPKPWLRTFCRGWNWSTCRFHFQQMRCTEPCTTQSNIQTCQYINQFDTYIWPIIPFSWLAIDVTITPCHLPITDGDDPSTSTYVASTISHHQQYERKKFGGSSINADNSYVLREQVIAVLNKSTSGKGNLQMIQKLCTFY
jgi:hypothetical protein